MHKKSWHKDLMHEKFMFMHENEFSHMKREGGKFSLSCMEISFACMTMSFSCMKMTFSCMEISSPCMKFPCHDFCIQETLRTGSCVIMYMYVYVNVAVSSTCTCIRTSALMAGWSTALPMTARCLSPLLVVPFVRCFYQLSIRHTLCTV